VQGGVVSSGKFAARVAASRFHDLLKFGPSIIESKGEAALFPMARNAGLAVAGLAAVAGVAFPFDANAAPMPDREVATSYMYEVNDALDASPGRSRIKSIGVRQDAEIRSNYRADVTTNGIIPLSISDQSCTVSVAPDENLRKSYSEFLGQLPPGSDLSTIPQMHGLNLCFARARLDEQQLAAFDRTKVGLAPVAEMMTVIGSMRSGHYEQVSKVEAASAAAMLAGPNEVGRAYALAKLSNLGAWHRYVTENPDVARQVKEASLEQLLDITVSVVASSHLNVSSNPEARMATWKGISPEHASQGLKLLNLHDAAEGARIASDSGLLKQSASISHGNLDAVVPNARLGRGQNYSATEFTEVSAAFSIPMTVAQEYGKSVKENLDYAFSYSTGKSQVALGDTEPQSPRRRF